MERIEQNIGIFWEESYPSDNYLGPGGECETDLLHEICRDAPPAYVVEALLRRGFDPNKRDYRDMTPLYIALSITRSSRQSSIDSIRILLEYGADPNVLCSSPAYSPLHIALQFGTSLKEKLNLLFQYGANANLQVNSNCLRPSDVDARFFPNHTPFTIAARNRGTSPQIFAILLQNGADPHTPDSSGITGHESILKSTKEKKAIYETWCILIAICVAKKIKRLRQGSTIAVLPIEILRRLSLFL
jgi:ankyrin repeat protein